jgi:uncharacterized protein (UPF0332 family)
MHEDLIAQAKQLAMADSRRPKQANLRRAISSAYYALFHFLVSESCRAVVGTGADRPHFRTALARAFEHTTMAKACASFGGSTLPASVSKGFPATFSIPAPLRNAASAFVEAQEKRHAADYDLTERFSRADVLAFVAQVEAAIGNLNAVGDAPLKQFFFVSLLTWNVLTKR